MFIVKQDLNLNLRGFHGCIVYFLTLINLRIVY